MNLELYLRCLAKNNKVIYVLFWRILKYLNIIITTVSKHRISNQFLWVLHQTIREKYGFNDIFIGVSKLVGIIVVL